MNPFKFIKELLRRSPLFRVVALLLFVALVFLVVHQFTKSSTGIPVISSVNPMVAMPGDQMTIRGENFGSTRGASYVEIAGSKLTASSYTVWSNKEIKVKLPLNVQDGLVVVVTSEGRSIPSFFANRENIPVIVHDNPETESPVIEEVSPASASIGQLVTITGKNFGNVRGSSQVFFTANRADRTFNQVQEEYVSSSEDFISANECEFDYNSWSDTEIHVRVPDGADSGQLYISTAKGESTSINIDITFAAGKKSFNSKRVYNIQTRTDVSVTDRQDSTLTLYSPRPQLSASQPFVEIGDLSAEPLIRDDPKCLIYQHSLIPTNSKSFSQNYVITVYEVNSNIKAQNITRYVNTKRDLYTTFTSPDGLIPSDNEKVVELKGQIVGKEKNPYKQARAIYDYFYKNYRILSAVSEKNSSVEDFISSKRGDACDFAVLYTALCRACGIPAVPVSGVLVDSYSSCRNHWWVEIYFENYGWFPVDPALAGGLNFKPFNPLEDSAEEYYFGNLDNQHVVFSRGWNQIKTSISSARPVSRSRTYALQSVWEDASSAEARYSSVWANPRLIGVE